jgi:outer membrane lipoprotein SlyB
MVWTRNYPVVLGGGVAILLFSLVGAAAISGVMPEDLALHNPLTSPLVDSTASAAAAKHSDCRSCGVIAAIRPIRIEGQSGTVAGFRVTVRMDDGRERGFSQTKEPGLPVGARVRVKGESLERG